MFSKQSVEPWLILGSRSIHLSGITMTAGTAEQTSVQQLQQQVADLERELRSFKHINEELTRACNNKDSAVNRRESVAQ
jgi:hypothetical protein